MTQQSRSWSRWAFRGQYRDVCARCGVTGRYDPLRGWFHKGGPARDGHRFIRREPTP